MLRKILNKIKSKRDSNNFFWRNIFLLKDLLWSIKKKKIAIIGAGGFGREIYYQLNKKRCSFFVEDEFFKDEVTDGVPTFPLSNFNKDKFEAIIGIGEGHIRERIVEKMPQGTKYFTFIHPSAQILSKDTKIGEGSFICAGSIISCNCKIGKHSLINLNSTIGHDCDIGNYLTTGQGVRISGDCKIGKRVFLGSNSSIKEKTKIDDDVVIGLNSCVIKDIDKSGIYAGVPAKLKKDIKKGKRYLK